MKVIVQLVNQETTLTFKGKDLITYTNDGYLYISERDSNEQIGMVPSHSVRYVAFKGKAKSNEGDSQFDEQLQNIHERIDTVLRTIAAFTQHSDMSEANALTRALAVAIDKAQPIRDIVKAIDERDNLIRESAVTLLTELAPKKLAETIKAAAKELDAENAANEEAAEEEGYKKGYDDALIHSVREHLAPHGLKGLLAQIVQRTGVKIIETHDGHWRLNLETGEITDMIPKNRPVADEEPVKPAKKRDKSDTDSMPIAFLSEDDNMKAGEEPDAPK